MHFLHISPHLLDFILRCCSYNCYMFDCPLLMDNWTFCCCCCLWWWLCVVMVCCLSAKFRWLLPALMVLIKSRTKWSIRCSITFAAYRLQARRPACVLVTGVTPSVAHRSVLNFSFISVFNVDQKGTARRCQWLKCCTRQDMAAASCRRQAAGEVLQVDRKKFTCMINGKRFLNTAMLWFLLCFAFPASIFFHQRGYVLPGVCLSVYLFVHC